MTQILPRFHRHQLEREDRAAVDRAVREARDEPLAPRIALTKNGDPRALRGVPICTYGVSGVSPGSDPFAETARRMRA